MENLAACLLGNRHFFPALVNNCLLVFSAAGTFGRVYHGKLVMANSSTEEYQDGTDAEVFIKTVTGKFCKMDLNF